MHAPYDTYRTAFLKFLADGMTHAEAFAEFDEAELRRAALDGIQHRPYDPDDETTLFAMVTKAGWEISNQESMDQAIELWGAGWTSEVPTRTNSKDFWMQCHTRSLYWRAPSKRAGKPGRRYLSTNQAWLAMTKSAP